MTTVSTLKDLPHWNAIHADTLGELVRKTIQYRDLADFYTKREMWLEAERCEMDGLDHQRAVSNRMAAMELLFVIEGPYYAYLNWLPSGQWYATVGPDRLDREIGLKKSVAEALGRG